MKPHIKGFWAGMLTFMAASLLVRDIRAGNYSENIAWIIYEISLLVIASAILTSASKKESE